MRLHGRTDFTAKAGDGYRGRISIKVYPDVQRQTFHGFGRLVVDGRNIYDARELAAHGLVYEPSAKKHKSVERWKIS